MSSPQEQYDDAMYDFSRGEYDTAIAKLESLLGEDANHFEARLALGMAYFRKGDFAAAIAEGHKAQALRPHEQLVHTNLSLFYMKAGDKKTAEHHGLQARIASWRTDAAAAKTGDVPKPEDPSLQMAKPPPPPPAKFPDMPWKKKKQDHPS